MKAMICLAVLAVGPAASGAMIEITATGLIDSSNLAAFPIGQSATVTLVYESAGSQQLTSNQQAFYVDHIRSIAISSGAWNTSDSGAFGQINKYDNLVNTDGIAFQVAAIQPTYQFTNPKPQTVSLADINGSVFGNLIMNFASFSNAVWTGYALPTSYDFAQFNQTQNALVQFNNGGFSIGWSNVSAREVPAPGSVALVGAAGVIGLGRRRR